ncbi:MAG: GNAT family N-acetyltransferase [Elusimicrobiales bacterium]|nr:GNAT family N-acetyltransferase [Elusimicrobiales bacterium]
MGKKKIDTVIKRQGQPDVVIRLAKVQDMRRIQVLYTEVYGASYSVSIITDRDKMRQAIEDDDHYWLVADCGGRIIGSLVYALDLRNRISKAFGAVVSQEYRKLDLAYTMMKLVLDDITSRRDLVDAVYATTRTANHAPQRLTESLGFVKLGIFPNTHKVHENETHCLTAYFPERALARRRKRPYLVEEIVPFYSLVRKQMDLEKPFVSGLRPDPSFFSSVRNSQMDFEVITAPEFIKNRWKSFVSGSFFQHTVMPFHDPNLLFITPDQKTEVYLHYNTKDKYSVVLGGDTDRPEAAVVLENIANKVNEMGMAYVEVIVDAYTPEVQRHALEARFIPSGYFPAIKKVGGKRYDCIVFSRTFEMLDFRNVRLISLYKNFLREYLRLWQESYINLAFKKDEKKKRP